jgi:hypothetical protein
MKKANYHDKDLLVDILTKSFETNQSVNIVKQDKKRIKRIRALMDYSFEVCYMFRKVFYLIMRKPAHWYFILIKRVQHSNQYYLI